MAKSKIDIKNRLNEFFESDSTRALIVTSLYSFGLIKENDDLFFFDSHSRTVQGKLSANGKACSITFSGNKMIDNLTDHICKFIDLNKITVKINDILCVIISCFNVNDVNFSNTKKYKI